MNGAQYKTVAAHASGEITEKKSRFIADVFPVTTEAEAQENITRIQKQYHDARHHCHAFVCGRRGELSRSSDNGEPSGTAGRPVFEVLKGSGITNVILTVTRYFGGTLLGTGGLVKAYQDAAKQVLALAKAEEYVEKDTFSFSTDYAAYKTIKHLFSRYHISGLQENYGAAVEVCGQIQADESEAFRAEVHDASKGKTLVEVKRCT